MLDFIVEWLFGIFIVFLILAGITLGCLAISKDIKEEKLTNYRIRIGNDLYKCISYEKTDDNIVMELVCGVKVVVYKPLNVSVAERTRK